MLGASRNGVIIQAAQVEVCRMIDLLFRRVVTNPEDDLAPRVALGCQFEGLARFCERKNVRNNRLQHTAIDKFRHLF